MHEKGFSIRDLAAQLHLSYERVRSVLDGRRRLSQRTIRRICECLDIPVEEINRLQADDELILPPEPGAETLAPLERFWNNLTEQHRRDLVFLARRWAAQDRAAKRSDASDDSDERSVAAHG